MSRATLHPSLISLALLLNRLSLGLYFLLAGIAKVRGGISAFYHTKFVPMLPGWVPNFFALPYGYSLPILEILVGACLILGLLGRLTGTIATLLILSFSLALIGADAFKSAGPFHPNLILLTLALLLALIGPGSLSLDQLLSHRRRRRRH
ncbi:MAG: DoxX family membrane protein [Phycisphaeraceae bacterium]|nr:DoxX family membrane protein [Phycisphaeraceae bacterium]